MTGVKLEKISDIDKYLFIKKNEKEEFFTLLKDMQKPTANT